MIKSGLAFHCHHDKLFEYVYDYDERIRYIKENKPKNEQKLRLRLFKLIPEDLVPGKGGKAWGAYCKAGEALDKAWGAYCKAGEALDKAWEAHGKAREAFDKAGEALDKAWEAHGKAGEAFDKAGEAHGKAWEAYDKAREAYRKKYHKELEELHLELCSNCPWNGKTILKED